MIVDIVIPTRKREEKLYRCLDSIFEQRQDWVRVTVYMDTHGDIVRFREMFQPAWWMGQVVFEVIPFEYEAARLWNHHLRSMGADGMLYLNDDVTLVPGSLKVLVQDYTLAFPKNDGVMGLLQRNLAGRFDIAPAAFGLVGVNFAKRFPARRVFCPDYKHLYIDRELEICAKAVGKFEITGAALDHWHPCTDATLLDETHLNIRRFKEVDMRTWQTRQRMGLVWGLSFELINGKPA